MVEISRRPDLNWPLWNCQSVTFLQVYWFKSWRGSPLGCTVSQPAASYLVLLQCRHLFTPTPTPSENWKTTLLWKQLTFLQTHVCCLATVIRGKRLAWSRLRTCWGCTSENRSWLCKPVWSSFLMQAFEDKCPALRSPSSPTNTPLCKQWRQETSSLVIRYCSYEPQYVIFIYSQEIRTKKRAKVTKLSGVG